ncbi:ubiquitin carboxyl-terminal hydrolase [Nitzschia inconspicua]|uniref:ubiquitinyl hydrolase 1 n=1 Tax=Nitzschia inconspicua TaxID=303405 RepID=A0A9K3M043_9STRA|nr:ubiquitin carboxyl-terminal hydrolase [Nitzschia inconspicua]
MLPPEERSNVTALTPPPQREVARAVQNLGNTCYMNAVLQALAHAPELCMAMDVQSHRLTCPIYKENVQKIANRSGPGSAASSRSSSPDHFLHHSGSQDLYSADPSRISTAGTRKSRRTRSPTNSNIMGSSSFPSNDGTTAAKQKDPNATKFCALCEVEQHMNNVHRGGSSSHTGNPVAPTNFVHGFIEHVAPWFKLGQQEDSHEFLRLLIDAMQKSCKDARPSRPLLEDPGNPQDTPPEPLPTDMEDEDESKDGEYPFQLFRGTVESKVTCGHCNSTSSTMDPIEDLGLEVSPLSPSSTDLDSVLDALNRFSRVEELDAGYKCEKCGKVGRATKRSRLDAIPPILTLHLKRFRYGAATDASTGAVGGNGSSNGTVRRSQRSSEVSQLMNSASSEWMSGKSGSAKIEGHSEFKSILDLKPFLTEQKTTLCRLFAVIVHVGKNSHSGHYLAYVRNIEKNEWWKMDDARVMCVDEEEVLKAEAYMLFYRVAAHPYSNQLKNQVRVLRETYVKQQAALLEINPPSSPSKNSSGKSPADTGPAASVKNNPRKRKAPEFTCGEDWARKKAFVPESFVAGLRDIEAKVSEYVNFTPTFLRMLREQASRPNAKVGHGPSSGICLEEDIDDCGTDDIKNTLLRCFMTLTKEQGRGLTKIAPTTRSAASRGRSQPTVPVVIPEEAEDVL